jgi:hypothetical protein
MGLSIRAYGRQRGVSHVAVLRAIKQGRVPQEPDGTIDPAKADASWERSTDPARAKSKAKTNASKLKPVGEAAVGSVRETLKEQGLPSGGNVTFVQARTAHEIAKAHLARLKLQERRGELIDRARATALAFRLAREERDAWANWPARIAALMASELSVSCGEMIGQPVEIGAHRMQKLLETHVRAHLAELADIRPQFR